MESVSCNTVYSFVWPRCSSQIVGLGLVKLASDWASASPDLEANVLASAEARMSRQRIMLRDRGGGQYVGLVAEAKILIYLI